MKKTILALAVPALLAAGVTNAATIYNNDGTTVDLKGSIRLWANTDSSRSGIEKTAQFEDEGSRFGIGVNHDLGNGLSAFGYLEYGNDTQTMEKDFKLTNRQGYAGFKMADIGAISFGRITAPFDDVALSDYTYEYGGVMNFGKMENHTKKDGNNFLARVSKSVKVETAEVNGFKAAASYTMQADGAERNAQFIDNKLTDNTPINGAYTLAAFYNTDFGLTLNAGYGHAKYNRGYVLGEAVDGAKSDIWGIGAQYEFGDFAVALDYGQARHNYALADVEKAKADLLGVGAKWNYGMGKVYAGFYQKDYSKFETDVIMAAGNVTSKDLNKEDTYTLGVDYEFSKSVVTFLEYAHVKTKYSALDWNADTSVNVKDSDNKVGLGLRVYF
ncbi:porin [Plesiomonas shigelloides]|uniref:porin n=1 Tax=Plesiomonas shigelloides TaxID=703 RepID=UPI0022481C86|nr:porin [Plesiomonas shigelloides]MCX2497203.1 porin [Plesiomonas shigelloides]